MAAEVNPHDAADRVEAFLDRRAQIAGLDPEEVIGLDGGVEAGGHSLTVADLRALVDGYRQIFSDWVEI